MRLRRLTVTNFLPFYGEQTLRFPADGDHNVLVVFGDNMRGKTSLLNAVRWVFYGEVLDRNRKPRAYCDIANMDSADEGNHEFGVTATFEYDGVDYELGRSMRLAPGVNRPTKNRDYTQTLFLRRGPTVLPFDAIEGQLSRIAPRQTARFFLFDAELLAEYEELLIEDSEQGNRIRNAVEQVLGVPALINGRDDLTGLSKEASAELAKLAKQRSGLEALSKEYEAADADLDSLRRDQRALEKQKAELQQEISGYDRRLERTARAEEAKRDIDRVSQELNDLQDRMTSLEQERLGHASEAWREMLTPQLQREIDRLRQEREQLQAALSEQGARRHEVEQLNSLLDSGVCPICVQPVSEEGARSVGKRLTTLKEREDATEDVASHLGVVGLRITQLGTVIHRGAREGLTAAADELGRLAVQQTRLENRKQDLEDQIRGVDTREIARVRTLRDRQVKLLGQVEQKVGEGAEAIKHAQVAQKRRAEIISRGVSGGREEDRARLYRIYGTLESVFRKGVDRLRDRLRASVERSATEAFLELTTDKSFEKLEINDVYGLSIVDRKGRKIPQKSAGAEQIVALALIHGLNRTGQRAGPILMDTPLGRLDPRHRHNVLQYLPVMASQVVLLVHEGEVSKEDGLSPVASRVGARYEIERITSSRSRIRKL